jgi:hypothetical protein
MTNPTAPETVEEPYQPFPDCARFDLNKSFNQQQLLQELGVALGSPVQMATTSATPGMPGATIESYLWVVPSSVDRAKVQAAIDAHVPDPNWGIPESVQAYRALLAKVQGDPSVSLTTDEMQTAVKGLLVRMSYVN